MTTYTVNEIFTSVQGEGTHVGVAATFIRLQGCSVGCPWCDSGPLADVIESKRTSNGLTRNTWGKGGVRMEVGEIVAKLPIEIAHIIITGGEPTIWNLDDLIKGITLRFQEETGLEAFIQLETSGQNALKGEIVPDWITWSPKENLDFEAPASLKTMVDEIKYVIDDRFNVETILEQEAWYQEFALEVPRIILMPEGCPPSISNLNKAYKMVMEHPDWRVIDRLQYRLGVR